MATSIASATGQPPPVPGPPPIPGAPQYQNSALDAAGRAARGASEAYRTGVEARSRAEELKIQQGWLDLARQQARAQQPTHGKDILGQPRDDIKQALLIAHMAHDDFDTFAPVMQIVAEALRPDWSKLTMSEYLECLYVIVKHASFSPGSHGLIPDPKAAK